MAKKKKYIPPVKATRRSVRVLVPGEGKGGEYAEAALHDEYLYDPYLATSRSEGGRRVGPIQFSRKTKSGRYKRKAARSEGGRRVGPLQFSRKAAPQGIGVPDYEYEEYYTEPTRDMGWQLDRDIRLLVFCGVVVAVFIIAYTALQMVFDAVSESMIAIGMSTADLDVFTPTASLVLGIATALLVGAGMGMMMFKEGDVDDSGFEA